MSVFTSKVHYNAKLKRFVVSYNKTDKILNCGCCTRKIVCVQKAMFIWFLEQTHVITHLDLGSASPQVTKKEKNIKEKNIKDKAKIKNEECNTGYPPINESILLEIM